MAVEKNEPPFWLVWSPQGQPPRYRHRTRSLAEDEALRLARECPGKEFYVLCPVTLVTRADVRIERFATDDIPF